MCLSLGAKLFVKSHLIRLKMGDQRAVVVSGIDLVVLIMLCAMS